MSGYRRRLPRIGVTLRSEDRGAVGEVQLPACENVLAIAAQADAMNFLTSSFLITLVASRIVTAQTPSSELVDSAFHPPVQSFSKIVALADGKYLVAGDFQFLGGTPLNRVARLNLDGSVDQSFDSGEAIGSVTVKGLAVQWDKRILVYGDFKEYHGVKRHRIVRLLPNGALDETFVPPADPTDYLGYGIEAVALDGERRVIYIGGNFNTQATTYLRSFLVRLKVDGSLDESFVPHPASEAPSSVTALAVDDQGRVLVAGGFVRDYQGYRGLARFLPDGSIDRSFKRVILDQAITRIIIQPDGRIDIGGAFTLVNQQPRSAIARLHPDGALDYSFQPEQNLGFGKYIPSVKDLALQNDGCLIVGGYVGMPGSWDGLVMRLRPDGTRDAEFNLPLNPSSRYDDIVNTFALAGNETLVLSGQFAFSEQTPASGCARVFTGNSPIKLLLKASSEEVQLRLQVHPGFQWTLETTSDLQMPWQSLASTNPITSGVWIVHQPADAASKAFYRVH